MRAPTLVDITAFTAATIAIRAINRPARAKMVLAMEGVRRRRMAFRWSAGPYPTPGPTSPRRRRGVGLGQPADPVPVPNERFALRRGCPSRRLEGLALLLGHFPYGAVPGWPGRERGEAGPVLLVKAQARAMKGAGLMKRCTLIGVRTHLVVLHGISRLI